MGGMINASYHNHLANEYAYRESLYLVARCSFIEAEGIDKGLLLDVLQTQANMFYALLKLTTCVPGEK